jgi:hypothetical protein
VKRYVPQARSGCALRSASRLTISALTHRNALANSSSSESAGLCLAQRMRAVRLAALTFRCSDHPGSRTSAPSGYDVREK